MSPAYVVAPLVLVLAALAAEPVVRCLPYGSCMAEGVRQPAWTRAAVRFPMLELLGLLLGLLCAWRIGWTATLAPALVLCAFLVPITAIDLEWRVIPDALVVPGAVSALVLAAFVNLGAVPWLLLSALVAGAVFLALVLVYPAGMGVGDVTLVAMLGAFLGPAVLVAVVLALVLSAVPAVGVLVARGMREGRKTGLPFGPFLAAGAVVTVAVSGVGWA